MGKRFKVGNVVFRRPLRYPKEDIWEEVGMGYLGLQVETWQSLA